MGTFLEGVSEGPELSIDPRSSLAPVDWIRSSQGPLRFDIPDIEDYKPKKSLPMGKDKEGVVPVWLIVLLIIVGAVSTLGLILLVGTAWYWVSQMDRFMKMPTSGYGPTGIGEGKETT